MKVKVGWEKVARESAKKSSVVSSLFFSSGVFSLGEGGAKVALNFVSGEKCTMWVARKNFAKEKKEEHAEGFL